jgi:hypothetical protein
MNGVINTLASSPGGIPGGLFIGVVRGSGNNVRTVPLIASFTLSVQSFYTSVHFTQGLSDDDTCPLLSGLRPMCRPGLQPC